MPLVQKKMPANRGKRLIYSHSRVQPDRAAGLDRNEAVCQSSLVSLTHRPVTEEPGVRVFRAMAFWCSDLELSELVNHFSLSEGPQTTCPTQHQKGLNRNQRIGHIQMAGNLGNKVLRTYQNRGG